MTARVLVLTAALAATGAAPRQHPMPAPPLPPSADTPDDRVSRPGVPAFVTVEGCVTAEAEVPGRAPDVAERAGIAEDYILTTAKVVKGKPPVQPPDRTGGAESNALRPMYEIGGLTGDQLKPHVGHRVQIEGTFANTNRDPGADDLNDNLVELTGSTIRQVPGACAPAKS